MDAADGCRISKCDDGSTIVRHPAVGPDRDPDEFSRRDLLDDEERRELAENYAHNYAQELRDGDTDATMVIVKNLLDPNLRPQLSVALVEEGIHASILRFLDQCDKPIYALLQGVPDVRSISIPCLWMDILRLMAQHDGCSDDTRFALAKGIAPLVKEMIDSKREMFRSNLVWHMCLPAFIGLVYNIMLSDEASDEGFVTMISYKGLLPFVARASSWNQIPDDIMAGARFLRCDYAMLACYEAQRVLCLVIREYLGVQDGGESFPLDQIARTPLSCNDPQCTDSTIVGLVRMLMDDSNQDVKFLQESILEPLLFRYNYVDARIIAALIEHGGSSIQAGQIAMNTMLSILGLNGGYERRTSDSRYAAAVRNGLLELCINVLISHNGLCDGAVAEGLHSFAMGLYSVALHSETSRALRKRKSQIFVAIDALRTSRASQSDEICSLINDCVESGTPICCNCLKRFDRKELCFCEGCDGIECYCSIDCQSQSYPFHRKFCKEVAKRSDSMRREVVGETALKRMRALSNNLMMRGCRFVESHSGDILDKLEEEKQQNVTVTIGFGQYPPSIALVRNDAGESLRGFVKCTFMSPVLYGFTANAGIKEFALEKAIPRGSLTREVLD